MNDVSDFLKVMGSIERRLTSSNSIPVERTYITAEEFEAISGEVQSLIMSEEALSLENERLEKVINECESEIAEFVNHQPSI